MRNLLDHTNKNVVITGVSGQIGQTLALNYLNLGANVFGIDIQPSTQIEHNGRFYFYKVDVADHDAVKEVFQIIRDGHGELDVLINNAGAQDFSHFRDRTEKVLDLIFATNVKAVFNCIESFVNNTSKNRISRSIVNVASIYGLVSPDFRVYDVGDRRSSEIYGITKAGVVQMTKYFAVALAAENIRVNCVSPGGVFNPINPQNKRFIAEYSKRVPLARMATAQEIVNAVVFLSSTAASYVNGHNLIVDGGYTVL
ncbi:SDR family oxidoreductase [bacterium]|nr:SDR family oxidoreductase [bacterium]